MANSKDRTMGKKRDVYRAIMIAAAKGKGLHLTADEVYDLSFDDAIATVASHPSPTVSPEIE